MESKQKHCEIVIKPPPLHLQAAYHTIFTQDAVEFLCGLIIKFEKKVEELHWNRLNTKCFYKLENKLPKFLNTVQRRNKGWKVRPLPRRLQDRRLDLGDVSPANTKHFSEALRADVQGVQVDFDDGHCPTWGNQILGLFNVYQAVHGNIHKALDVKSMPVLMLRPRAWNMVEHNIMINGKKVPGPLVDFGLLIYHNYQLLIKAESGPFFYLSKLEGASEAKLWNEIFVWAQTKLCIPHGTIKACVLIENILSSFEMDEILYELKDHSLGLNCGIWDYAASIICKFGDRAEFVLPDRNKYVNMQRHFLKKYMELVIQTCHSRGAHATGGMAALLTTQDEIETIRKVVDAKRVEILCGVDGFMVYDLKLVPHMNKLWRDQCGTSANQLNLPLSCVKVTEKDLLLMPSGGVTFEGIKHNTAVAILFIYNWLQGKGHFVYKNAIEDSATAEISRSQIWQWIRHEAIIEACDKVVTKQLIEQLTFEYVKNQPFDENLWVASELFLEIISAPFFPDFITTYLNDNYIFREKDKEIKNLRFIQKL